MRKTTRGRKKKSQPESLSTAQILVTTKPQMHGMVGNVQQYPLLQ